MKISMSGGGLAALIIGASGSVSAQVAPSTTRAADAPVANAGESLETIVVTGVRGTSARTIADSPVPIDVIGRRELEATGRTGLKEVLGSVIPSLSVPTLAGGGTSATVKPIAIRGLSGDYLLVLVNGKRRHTTSLINNLARISGGSTPVDIDLIPTSGVGRIELLRDGAAAQYGSDAISGVLNIILDDTPTGGSASFTAGQLFEKKAALLQGTASYGAKLGDGGFVRFSVEAKQHNPASSSGVPVPAIYPVLANGSPDPREATANKLIATAYGRGNRDRIVDTSYDAELPISENATLYSFSTLSYRAIKDRRGFFFPAPTGYGGLVNPVASSVLPQIYPDGFQTYRLLHEWDYQVAFGLKSSVAGWALDLSSSFGRDAVRLDGEGTLNPSLGPTSPTSFYMGRQKQTLWVNNLDLSHRYDIGLFEPVTVALGFEHRWEKFQNIAGEPDSYRDGGYIIPRDDTLFGQLYGGKAPSPGLVSFTGTSPDDAVSLSRNNVAAYLDVSAKVTPSWYVGLAGRVEHYDDSAGNTLSGKVTTRYEITPRLAIRGGVNTGFRAPSLAQSAFSTTQNTTTIIGSTRVSTTAKLLRVDSPAALALGAQPLRPERSLNFTAGISYEAPRFRVTIDGYQVRIDDRVVKTELLGTASNGGAAIKSILVANGVTTVDSAQFFTNAIDTRTRGVDVVAEYSLPTARLGTFRLSAAYSYNETKILSVIANPAALSALNVTLFGRQARQDLLVATPKSKLIFTGNWTLGRARALLRTTRYGSYVEASNVAASDRYFSAKWITDLEVGYDLTRHLTLSIGANNLFDVYPDRNGIIVYEGTGQYGNFSPYGLSGGFYYGRVSVRF